MEPAEHGVDKRTSAFIAWAAKHNVDVQDREGWLLPLDFGTVNDICRQLRKGYDLWTSANIPPERYYGKCAL